MASAGSITIYIGANTTQLQKVNIAVNKVEKRVKLSAMAMSRSMGRLGSSMRMLGMQANRYLTIPIALAVGVSAKKFMEYEAALAKVTGLVGVSKQQVKRWSGEILALSANIGKAPLELAEAMYFITSAGLRGEQAMKVLNVSSKASAAGLGTVAVVADIVTSAMNAYGKSNLSAAEATDILVKTVREGKAEADKIGKSMGMVLPIASAMGVTFDQVGAAMAAMTRTGTKASTAAMQLRRILGAFMKPAKQSSQALGRMGASFKQLRDVIKEKGLLTAFTDLDTLTKIFGEDTIARILPNIRAFTGFVDIMGKNLKYNIKIFESLASSAGALDSAFTAVSKTMQQKWNETVAQANATLIQMGESLKSVLIPMFKSMSDWLKNVATWFATLTEAQKRSLIKWGAIAVAIGPVLTAIGFMASGISALLLVISRAILVLEVLKKGFIMVSIGMKAMSVSGYKLLGAFGGWLLNPYILALIALAAIITVIIIKTNKLTVAQKALKEVERTTIANTVKKRMEIQKLLNIMESEFSSLKQKENALNVLRGISPAYLGDITQEAVETGKAVSAIDEYINSIYKKAEAQAAYNKLVELQEQKMGLIIEKEKDHLSGWQKFRLAMTAAAQTSGSYGISTGGYSETYDALYSDANQKQRSADFAANEAAQQVMKNLLKGQKLELDDIAKKYEYIVKHATDLSKVEGDMLPTIKEYAAEVIQHDNNIIKNWKKIVKIRLGGDEEYNRIAKKLDDARQNELSESTRKQLREELEKRREQVHKESAIILQAAKDRSPAMAAMADQFSSLYTLDITELDIISAGQKTLEAELTKNLSQVGQYHEDAKTSTLDYKKSILAIYKSMYGKGQTMVEDNINVQDAYFTTIGGHIIRLNKEIDNLTESTKKSKKEIFELTQAWNMPDVTKNKLDMEAEIGLAMRNFNLLGNEVDFVSDRIQAYQKYVNAMKGHKFLDKEDEELFKMINIALEGLLKKQKESNKATKDYVGTMDDLNWKIETLGGTTELLNEKLRMQQKVLTELINLPKDKITDSAKWMEDMEIARTGINATKDALAVLELQLEGNMGMLDSFGQALYNIGNVFSDIGGDGALGQFGDALTKVGRIIGNIISLIDAVKTITLIYKAVTGATIPIIKAETGATTGLAAAQGILALNTAVAMAAMTGYPALLVAIPTAAGTVATALLGGALAAASQMSMLVGGATGLKDGGIIPAGYSGDRFPAMLDSNEAVIPLERLPELLADAGVGNEDGRQVTFVIEGKQLEGVLYKQENINRAF